MADRVHAQAGINADYYDIGASGSPLNVVLIDGRVQHQPDAAAAFIIGRDRRIGMATISWRATLSAPSSQPVPISNVNEWSAATPIALLSAMFGGLKAYGASVLVLTPADAPGRYRVADVLTGAADLPKLSGDELAIVAHGAWAIRLGALGVGQVVDVTQQSQPQLDSMLAAVGGGPLLLDGGSPAVDPNAPAPEETNARYPLTGAGISADGSALWLVVIDGRSPAMSVGVTRPMLAALFARLGAWQAMAFDSGGSSEMVVRHLGDLGVTVANVPSDGRERPVADGLFVLNNARPGTPAQLLLRADDALVLSGSRMPLRLRSIDADDQPLPVTATEAAFKSSDPRVLTVDARGVVQARQAGGASVEAVLGSIRGRIDLRVVSSVGALVIGGYRGHVPADGAVALSASALAGDVPVWVDPQAVRWSAIGSGGKISSSGTFRAGPAAARLTIVAQTAGTRSLLPILVGEHAVKIAAVLQPGSAPGQWAFGARPADVAGGVDALPAPDASAALHLSYDFSAAGSVRAAYAQTDIPLAGEPTGVAIDVYADSNGQWLRGGFRNADGLEDSVTLARHVDWRGWKTLEVSLPERIRTPITWTRLYAVEPDKEKKEQGDLWFRNFRALYPGPR